MRTIRSIPVLAALAAGWLAGCSSTPEEHLEGHKSLQEMLGNAKAPIIRSGAETDADLDGWKKLQEERKKAEDDRLSKQPKVTANFVDMPLRDAIFEISTQAKIPVVVDQSVAGDVTLNLEDVPFETALRLLVFSGNYAWSREGAAYFVATLDPKSPTFATLTTTRIIRTYHPPKLIATSLSKAYADYITYSEGTNVMVLTGPTSILDRIEEDLQLIDRPPLQVLIDVLVVETKIGSEHDLGLEYSKLVMEFEESRRLDNSDNTFDFEQLDITSRLTIAFDLLAAKNKASIKSHPQIVTSNGVPAEIRSLTEQYIVILRGGTTFTSANLEVIKSGTTLKVTPVVTRNGEIELTLEPEVADVIGVTDQNGTGQTLPVISRRGVKSTVRVRNGDVIIIGGLYEENARTVRRGLPFLKDVPVLNILTSREVDKVQSSELLIFVSPKILK